MTPQKSRKSRAVFQKVGKSRALDQKVGKSRKSRAHWSACSRYKDANAQHAHNATSTYMHAKCRTYIMKLKCNTSIDDMYLYVIK